MRRAALAVRLPATGLPASPGAASGEIVFNSEEAEAARKAGRKVIPADRFLVGDEALARQLDGDAQGRLGGALAVAGLELLHPTIDPKAERKVIATGLPASPGAASGEIVFNSEEAEA
jgi:phosphoenolpyruvate synthase/pyruvate phosphate dikinase